MKRIKILFGATAIGLATIITGDAQVIIQNLYPPMTLNIGGVFTWNNGIGGNHVGYEEWDTVKVRFGSKDLINLLNSSATFTNVLYNVKGVTQIPAGSYLKIDINQPVLAMWWNEWAMFVTNRNGFNCQLNSVYDPVQNQYYNFVEIYHDYSVGSGKFFNATSAGHEADMAAIHFTFNNGAGTYFEFFGVGDFNWTAAPMSRSFSQEVKVAGKVTGGGNAVYIGMPAVMRATLTVKGAGVGERFPPFQMWSLRNAWVPGLGFPPLVR